jgi:uncharacterized membrane protein (UPF0127 family)
VVNCTRSTTLATQLETAATSAARNKGLLGRQSLGIGHGLWIVPCQSVHTATMRFAIDLVYLDRRLRVRKVVARVVPWRISLCLPAHSVIELPAGTIAATQTRRGDQLAFEAVEIPERTDA